MHSIDIIATTALIYANGDLHLGHLLEHIQADIWVRFQRMQGQHCLLIGGNDAHGTPIMLSSQKQGLTPEALVERIHARHQSDLSDFHIHYDEFSTTHTQTNESLTVNIFEKLASAGVIETRVIEQPYDTLKGLFLPDRYLKGTCPRCNQPDQYGDNCEACGATYDACDLIDPKSTLSDTTPVMKTSKHYFLKLEHMQPMLESWLMSIECESSTVNKLKEWFVSGLKAWDISRDAPYFGFNIPNEPDRYFYVWLDAPIGYMAATQLYCQKHSHAFESLWHPESKTKLVHFIGKDITYFHGIFWPSVLDLAGFRKPSALYTHGFLTIEGSKMSKSRNTFITARDYLNHLDPDYLRYYFASKLSAHAEDLDLNWDEFKTRIDAELVGKIINIASRCAKLLAQHFNQTLSAPTLHSTPYDTCIEAAQEISQHFESRQYAKALNRIGRCADTVNHYLTEQAPWTLIKTQGTSQQAHDVCTIAIECFRCLMYYLKPVTPELADRAAYFLNSTFDRWTDATTPLGIHTLNPYEHLLSRVPKESLELIRKSNT